MELKSQGVATKGVAANDVTPLSAWQVLTWDDLRAWTDERTIDRGKSYFRSGRVTDLAVSRDGELVARVQGTERYSVRAALGPAGQAPRLSSLCTCPVGYACKHAVAAVIACLDALAHGREVPTAEADELEWDSYDDDPGGDDEEQEIEDAGDDSSLRPARRANRSKTEKTLDSVREYLSSQSAGQLVDLVLQWCQEIPELRRELRERALLNNAPQEQLLKAARKELRDVTSQEVWWHHWEREGNLPDYSRLKRMLERLLEAGCANYLLEFGVTLLRDGTAQVENGQDEGQTALEIADCLEVVFQAVQQCGLDNHEKLLFAIYAELIDEYELAKGAELLLSAQWPAADWSVVADVLLQRLKSNKPAKQSQRDWRRRALAERAADALQAAGRAEEMDSFLATEAERSGDYQRWIDRLIDSQRLDEAEQQAREALRKVPTEGGYWGGVHLDQLLKIATLREDWPTVAAHAAEAYFEIPSVESFQELMAAAGKAGCQPQVRCAALEFLKTGNRPQAGAKPRSRGAKGSWPLPQLDYWPHDTGRRSGRTARNGEAKPRYDVLLEIAIAENRVDDVVDIYDRHFAAKRKSLAGLGWFSSAHDYAAEVAACVAERHPGPAAEIYQRLIQQWLTQTGDNAYQQVVSYLRRLRPILARAGRGSQWQELVTKIRDEQRRKRKLLEMLNTLDDRPIVDELRR